MRLSPRASYGHALMLILFVADPFHPVDDLAVELFLNSDVRHGRSGCGSVPVFLAGREPDHITRPDLLDWSAFAPGPTAACRDDEGLTERMRMPRSPRTRIESYASTLNKCRIRCLEQQRIDRYRASEPLRRTPDGRLRANSFDVHISYSLTSRLSYVVTLFPKPLEPIRQLRSSLAAVGEFANEQRERLRASSDPESASIHRIKARVMDQLGSDILGTLVVAAIHQARPSFFAFGFEHAEQYFTPERC